MNTIEIEKCCPECESTLVDDVQNGERICSGCGVVVAEQMADYGPEARSSSLEEKMKLARATGQTTYSQHDLGITTEISISTKDYSGKTINSEVANQMNNLRKWQQRIRVSSPRERRLSNVLAKIGDTCKVLNLSKNVLETSSMVYRNLDGKMDVKGKSVASITAATIFMACKQCDVVRSLNEICAGIGTVKDLKAKTKLAAKYYRTMVMELGASSTPVVTMDKYISKIANLSKTDVRVERLALEIFEKTRNRNLADGKAPNGIAAAYLYVASILLGQNVLQRDVSSVAGVTEVTIRNRCKEILTCYKLSVTLRPSLA
ncbi:MAG: transcription factor IIB [Nitrososphaerota archaeon]|jgi:transcription initiation factor TFIIB|nr:transcription factor IIB [Nitrososphaerota archaeon]MCH8996146.1 transcription factor IIB [Nitrososphaerota archaeon]MDG7054331.1 transcription factor IIB [Nitrososphaerota archaeon]